MAPTNVSVLHGAGYAGRELLQLVSAHPLMRLHSVTSASAAGKPIWDAHPGLRGIVDLRFVDPNDLDSVLPSDLVFVAAEHGRAAITILSLLEAGFEGKVIDLSADFRFKDQAIYPELFGFEHPAPSLLSTSVYGLPELTAPYPVGARLLANPGCFATGIALAVAPVSQNLESGSFAITAMTGASGSGIKPKAGTHFPERDGNVRAYKVFRHQHVPEVEALLGRSAHIHFVPVSGPWTRGIWGTVHVELPRGVTPLDVRMWFEMAYGAEPFVRLWPNSTPELRFVVGTPFCDIGWQVDSGRLVVVFSLDNLLKGAASQAVQNGNLLLGLPHESGLLPANQDSYLEPISQPL